MALRFASLITALLVTTSPALANDTVLYGPAPKWAEVRDTAKIDIQSNTVIALLDVQRRIEGDTLHVYVDQAIKLGSPEALTQGGTSTASWIPDQGTMTVHRVEIIRAGKVIDVIDGGARYEVLRREPGLEQRQIDGVLTATLSIPGLQVGDILRVTYSQTMRDKALQGKVQIVNPLLSLPIEAGFARNTISWPKGMPLRWQAGPAAGSPNETIKDGWHTVSIPLPLAKREDMPEGVPSRFTRLPILEATTFASWEEVSRVFAPLFSTKDTIPAGSPLAAEVAKIGNQSTDPLTRTALATRLVQDHVSYLSNGMSGGNYVPQAPARTWMSRFGDCKAKSLLLLALLEALGVKAEIVIVNTQLGDAVPQLLPMPAAFNHVIVKAEIEGVTYWLDGTATGTRLANLDEVPPFRNALPIRPAGAPLITISPRAPKAPQATVEMVIDQRAGIDLPALITAKTAITGVLASHLGAAISQASENQKKEMVEAFAGPVFETLSEHGGLITDSDMIFDPEKAVATVTIKGIVTTQFRQYGGGKRMELASLGSANVTFDFDRSRMSWKTLPVDLGQAAHARQNIEVLLPLDEPGFKLGGRPDYAQSFADKTVTRNGKLEGQQLLVSEVQSSLGGELPASDIPIERAKVLRMKNLTPTLTSPFTAARAWRYQTPTLKPRLAPVEAAFAKAIARDDEGNSALTARARFRAGTYNLEGAIADYDKIISIAADANNYGQRGHAKQLLGRIEAAILDRREALALSPSIDTALPLAMILGEAGKIDEALKLLDEYDDMGDQHSSVVTVRADILAFGGKAPEGLKEIEALIDEKPGDISLLNASCWYRARFRVGVEGMIDVCNEAVEKGSNAAAVLDSRAMAGIASGDLTAALNDVEAALKLAPQQVQTQFLRAWIANAMGKPEGKADLAYFRKAMPGFVQEYARYGLK